MKLAGRSGYWSAGDWPGARRAARRPWVAAGGRDGSRSGMRLWVVSGPLDRMAWTRSARAGQSGFGRADGSEEWSPAEVVQGGCAGL